MRVSRSPTHDDHSRHSIAKRVLAPVILGELVVAGTLYTTVFPRFLEMYEDSEVELPAVTALVARVLEGGAVVTVIGALLAVCVGAAAVTIGLRGGPRAALLIALTVVLALLIITGVVAIFYPLYTMMGQAYTSP